MTWGLVNSLASAATIAVALPLIVSQVGLDAYGRWALLALFVGVAGASDLGIARSLVANITVSSGLDVGRVIAAGLVTAAGIALAVSVAIAMAQLANSALWGRTSFVSQTDGVFVLVAGIVVILMHMLNQAMRGALEGLYCVHLVSKGFALQTFLYYMTGLAAAALSGDWHIMVLTSVVTYAIVGALHWYQLRALFRVSLVWPDRVAIHGVLREGLASYLALLPSSMLLPMLGFLFVRESSSATEFGTYDLAIKVTILVTTGIATVGLPVMALAASRRSAPEALRSMGLRLTGLGVIAFVLSIAGLWLVGPTLMQAVLPNAHADVVTGALMALSGAGVLAAAEPLNRVLLGLGLVRAVFCTRFGMLCATLVALSLIDRPPLERFTLSYAVGCSVCGFLVLFAFYRATSNSTVQSARLATQNPERKVSDSLK